MTSRWWHEKQGLLWKVGTLKMWGLRWCVKSGDLSINQDWNAELPALSSGVLTCELQKRYSWSAERLHSGFSCPHSRKIFRCSDADSLHGFNWGPQDKDTLPAAVIRISAELRSYHSVRVCEACGVVYTHSYTHSYTHLRHTIGSAASVRTPAVVFHSTGCPLHRLSLRATLSVCLTEPDHGLLM